MAETLAVEDLLKRIRQLTGDLEKIRQGSFSRIGPPETSLNANKLFEVGNAQAIAEVDDAIDDLQHTVWLYTETASTRGQRNTPSPSKLLSRATDILCALSTHPPLPRQEPNANGASFVERLIKLMEITPDPVQAPDAMTEKATALHKPGAEHSRA